MSKVKFRSQFSPKAKAVGLDCRFDLVSGEELHDMCHQEFRDECDINNVVARYLKTGIPPVTREAFARYGDFSQVPDCQEMLVRTAAAREAFASLDARTREAFDNQPEKLIAAINDPKQAQRLVDLGLASIREPEPSKEVLEARSPVTRGDIDRLANALKPSKKAAKSDED